MRHACAWALQNTYIRTGGSESCVHVRVCFIYMMSVRRRVEGVEMVGVEGVERVGVEGVDQKKTGVLWRDFLKPL